jgi:hypothetical protein
VVGASLGVRFWGIPPMFCKECGSHRFWAGYGSTEIGSAQCIERMRDAGVRDDGNLGINAELGAAFEREVAAHERASLTQI